MVKQGIFPDLLKFDRPFLIFLHPLLFYHIFARFLWSRSSFLGCQRIFAGFLWENQQKINFVLHHSGQYDKLALNTRRMTESRAIYEKRFGKAQRTAA